MTEGNQTSVNPNFMLASTVNGDILPGNSTATDSSDDSGTMTYVIVVVVVYSASCIFLLSYTMRKSLYNQIEDRESHKFLQDIESVRQQADRDAVELTKLRFPQLFRGYPINKNSFGVSFEITSNKRLVRTLSDHRMPRLLSDPKLCKHSAYDGDGIPIPRGLFHNRPTLSSSPVALACINESDDENENSVLIHTTDETKNGGYAIEKNLPQLERLHTSETAHCAYKIRHNLAMHCKELEAARPTFVVGSYEESHSGNVTDESESH